MLSYFPSKYVCCQAYTNCLCLVCSWWFARMVCTNNPYCHPIASLVSLPYPMPKPCVIWVTSNHLVCHIIILIIAMPPNICWVFFSAQILYTVILCMFSNQPNVHSSSLFLADTHCKHMFTSGKHMISILSAVRMLLICSSFAEPPWIVNPVGSSKLTLTLCVSFLPNLSPHVLEDLLFSFTL